MKILRRSTKKNINSFLNDLEAVVSDKGFIVVHKDKANLAAFYRDSGVELPDDFDIRMIQICRPKISGKLLLQNPERAIFIQKFIFVFSRNGNTEVSVLGYSADIVSSLLGNNIPENGISDTEFAKNLEKSLQKIGEMIDAAL